MFEPPGQQLATSLIAALISERLDSSAAAGGAGGVDELSLALQSGAGAYFKEHDRVFYQVGAEQAPAPCSCPLLGCSAANASSGRA